MLKSTRGLRILALLIIFSCAMAAIPTYTYAASKKQPKVKVTITYYNATSNTVIKKGQKYKIQFRAKASNSKKVKMRFKSSNRRIATVTNKGVIKARRKGKAKITAYAYVNGKRRGKKTITVRIGTPVTAIAAGGNLSLNTGKTTKLPITVYPTNATNKTIVWSSSNPAIVRVDKAGNITGVRQGQATVTVSATDGSCINKTIVINVYTPVSAITVQGYTYLRAGRTAKLNATVCPDEAANKRIIWTSSNPNIVKVDQTGTVTGIGSGKAIITASAADGSGVKKTIPVYSHKYSRDDTNWIAHRGYHVSATENTAEAFRLAGENGFWGCECDIWETRHVQREVKSSESQDYSTIEDEENAVTDTDIDAGEEEADDTLITEDFEIVINHDSSFKRVFGIDALVEETTAEEIRANSSLEDVCFFDTYLEICKEYKMIPIIEIKDYDMSDEGIAKFVDMVNDAGLLQSAQFISFDADVLDRTQDYILDTYNITPYTGYLIGGGNVSSAVNEAKVRGFTGINIAYNLLSPTVNSLCSKNGLKICTWTYNGGIACDEWLYKHIISGQFDVFSTTTDVKYY